MDRSHEDFVANLLDRFGEWYADAEARGLAGPGRKYYPYKELFSPLRVNRLTLKNRIVMGPMGNINMAEELGRPGDRMIRYFAERARGGAGLLTTGLVPVGEARDPTLTERDGQSYFPRILGSRTLFPGWRDLAQAVHAFGAHLFVQLTPGLGRVGNPETLLTKHRLPVSASWNPNYYIPAIPCRPLSDAACLRIIRDAGQAAANAQAMGLDGVYLHGHEGYLLEQLSNPAFNRRRFGRYADWRAFGRDLVQEIRRRVGPDYAIMYRIDLSLALRATYGGRMEKVASLRKFRRERGIGETLDYLVELVGTGVDLFDVDLGCYDNWWLPHPPGSVPSGAFLPVARLVKESFEARGVRSKAGLPVPVVAVGKLGYPDLAEKALRDGMCDMIMLARPLLADPDWPAKAFAGRVEEIRPCIGDQEACLNELPEGGHLQCSVNPRTGNEHLLPREPERAARPRRVAVVGAGPAGFVAATTASRRGHEVTLYEARDRVGGWLVPGSVPRIKYEVGNYLSWLEGELERAGREDSLELRLGVEATPELLAAGGFDAVLLATGAKPVLPKVEGIEARPGAGGTPALQAVELLLRPEAARKASEIVIVGGGAVGCETAHWLAAEQGKRVTIIEMLPYFMKGLCTANRGHLIHELERLGVRLLNCARLIRVGAGEIEVERNVSPSVPDPLVTWAPLLPDNIPNPLARPLRQRLEPLFLKADLLVLAVGLRPDGALHDACRSRGVAPEIHSIGDGFKIGRVFEAVKAGFALGSSL